MIAGKAYKYKLPLVVLAAAAAMLFAGYFVFKDRLTQPDRINKGVTIEGIDVSGLPPKAAVRLIEEKLGPMEEGRAVLCYGGKQWKVSLKDISYMYQTEEAVSKAFSLDKGGSFFKQLVMSLSLINTGLDIPLYANYDKSQLREILEQISREIDTAGKNAVVSYEKGVLNKVKEVPGKKLNVERSMNEAGNKLKNREFDDIELVVDEILPEITMSDIENITGVISEFQTSFSTSQRNRRDNIKLAVDTIDDTLILPGEIFSMNRALGPRTLENGYKKAPVIFKNEMIQGEGGGVCQVTTTLYNCVLKAGLEVLERSPHSRPLGYIKPGQDATIAGDSVDFKFKNNLGYPVLLSAEVVGGTIYMNILGKKENLMYEYRLISDIIKVIKPGKPEIKVDNSLEDDETVWVEKPRNGVRAVLYRDVYDKQGRFIKREKISTNYYKPVNGVIKANSRYEP